MRRIVLALLSLAMAAPALAETPAPSTAGPRAMVSAANPAAVEAGLKVLKAGGSALDAAVAVQATLGLVEPQSSGLGGGAFMTYYDAKTRKVTAFDGRETAPAGATAEMFLGADGKPMPFFDAVNSGRSAGAPGAIAMLYLAHKSFGKLPWSGLFDDTERLADAGMVVGPRLAGIIAQGRRTPDLTAYFSKPDGTALTAGERVNSAAYAATLRRIAAEGPDALLKGQIASDIVAALAKAPMPGTMTLADLAAYRPKSGPALCRPYRVWIVCVPNVPSGGLPVLEGLGLLQRTDIGKHGPHDAQGWLQLAEAQRLAYADRDYFEGDPAFVKAPVEGLLAASYLDARAKLIGDQAGPPPTHGDPAGAPRLAADATNETHGTSSFIVVDDAGNVAAVTTTVEGSFGDGRMVGGFLLNNQLTDFSFAPKAKDGTPAANAVAPGKRPRSSMSPTIVLTRDGRFYAAIGSPGGPAIPAYVLKVLVGVLDWNLSMQEAINLPNVVAMGPMVVGERAKLDPDVATALDAKGLTVRGGFGEGSGLHGVLIRNGRLEGGADPRREGVAVGY